MATQQYRSLSFLQLLMTCAILIGCAYVTSAQGMARGHEIRDQFTLVSDNNQKPNIIFILVDDLGYGDVGVFFQNKRREAGIRSEPWLHTPALDKLASEGAMLTDHYCAAPVCAPSRASLLSGLSQGHAEVRDNQFDKALPDNYTLANVLKETGYATAAIGKWGLQGKDKVGGEWPAHPLNRGFDYFLGAMRHVDGHEHYPKEGVYRGSKEVWENHKEISSVLDKCYTSDLWTAAAKHWIVNQKKANRDQPFFMYLAFDTPHVVLELPTQAYPDGGGLEGGLQWLGKPGEMINTATGKVDSWTHPDHAHATWDHDKDASTPEVAWPETYKRYATMVRRLDNAVKDLMQLLEDLGIGSNTMIVFTSDNGPERLSFLPKEFGPAAPTFFDSYGPFDGIKRDVLEGGVRVPTIAYWKDRIPAGTVVRTPSMFHDWMPTLCAAAGVAAPVRTDGVSLLPSLTGEGEQKPGLVYVEYFEKGETPGYDEFVPAHRDRIRKQMQMIRLGDIVGLRYNIRSAEDDFEIYDVVKDPQQATNIANGNDSLQRVMKESVLQVRRPDEAAPRPYDDALVPSVEVSSMKRGLKLHTFQTDLSWIPQTDRLRPVTSAYVSSLKVKKRFRENVFLFEGYIRVPEDGEYTFYMTADHKAFLRIHDIALIDEDYGHHQEERSGKILLEAGLHPLKIYYMKPSDSKKSALTLSWSSAGNVKAALPSNAYFCQGNH